jgi:hypothetical protein
MDAQTLLRQVTWTLVLVTTGVAIACKTTPTPQPFQVTGRPECPMDSVLIVVTDTVDNRVMPPRAIINIPVAGPITNIPEFHDCQRFIVGKSYGPLVAIFAHDSLDSLYYSTPDSSAEFTGAAAEIYSYDGDYTPLRIRQGFNCLYLRQAHTRWEAILTYAGTHEKACLGRPTGGVQLNVIAQKPMPHGDDYPPVARWDWDPANETQYISIRCGNEWCEVGRSDLHPSEPHAAAEIPAEPVPDFATTAANEQDRVTRIKGWYDEQTLAEVGATGLKLSGVRGTVFPHPLLERMKDVADYAQKWRPVAYVRLDRQSDTYKSKLNLEKGLNRIYECYGDFAQCRGRGSSVPEPPCEAGADHQWWAKIVSAEQSTEYRCVHRRVHAGIPYIPGVVRWRWDEHDEKLWIRCPQGCCTVN